MLIFLQYQDWKLTTACFDDPLGDSSTHSIDYNQNGLSMMAREVQAGCTVNDVKGQRSNIFGSYSVLSVRMQVNC